MTLTLSLEPSDLEKPALTTIAMYCCSILTGILCTPEYKIHWEEASRECKTKYESELITYQYIGEKNLTAEIIKELGMNVEAWIDGKVKELGCTEGENIKRELTLY